jgi:protein gp37
MNRTSIDWLRNDLGGRGWTWNPLTGCCGPADGPCPYCYARGIATRFAGTKAFPNGFAPTWHPERLDEPMKVKTPSRIFCGSMTDFFGPWVSREQFGEVLCAIAYAPQHTFYMLTKWPQNITAMLGNATPHMLPNLWIGASVTNQQIDITTAAGMVDVTWPHKFVSIEPLHGFVGSAFAHWAQWCIVGAESGPGAEKHRPERRWVDGIIEACDIMNIPVFLKSSITALWPDMARQEWPNG